MFLGWGKARWHSWWSIIRILPQAGRAVPVAALLNLVIGLLPLGFVVATSVAISRVPALGQSAHGAWGPVLAAMTLAIVALLLQSALSPFQAAFTELISRRVDGFCTRRLMRRHAHRGAGGPAGAGGRARQAERRPPGPCRVLRRRRARPPPAWSR